MAILALSAGSTPAQVLRSSSQFSQWSTVDSNVFGGAAGGGGASASGGNPGACYAFHHSVPGTGLPASVAVVHYPTDAQSSIDPGVEGCIRSVTLSVDFRAASTPNNAFGNVIAFDWAAVQGGTVYVGPASSYRAVPTSSMYVHLSDAALDAAAFRDANGASPDFSSFGAPIAFGVWTANSCLTGCQVSLQSSGYFDNFSVSADTGGCLDVLGAGCGPGLVAPSGPGLAGSPWTVRMPGVPAGFVSSALIVGLDFGAPFDLSMLGAPGCDFYLLFSQVGQIAPVATTTTSADFVLPGVVPRGTPFRLQGVVLVPGVNALNVVVSDAARVIMG